MFGYATNETRALMPMPVQIAHTLARRLSQVRKDGTLDYLRPDGKTQVTVRYRDGSPVEVVRILISTQHADGIDCEETIKPDLWEHVIVPVLDAEYADLYDAESLRRTLLVNPTGQVRDRRPGRRRRSDRPQDHRRHLRRRRPSRRRRVQRQGPVEGRPLGRLRRPLRGQERRRRGPRGSLRGPARLRDRRRPPGLADGRDLRHRQGRRREADRRRRRGLRPPARRVPRSTSTCIARSTRRPPPTATSAATTRTSPGSGRTGSTPSARPPAPRPVPPPERVGRRAQSPES